jgi:molecular chaperone DnaK
MHIAAKDKSTGKENKITIKSDSGLSKEEIERMVVEAEQNAESDKKTRTLFDTRNQAEATLHEIEKDLEEFKDQLTTEQVEEIQAAVTAVEIAKQGDDADKIKAELEKVFPAMASLLEKKQAKEQAAQAPQPEAKADDNVVDATFTETKSS